MSNNKPSNKARECRRALAAGHRPTAKASVGRKAALGLRHIGLFEAPSPSSGAAINGNYNDGTY